MVSTVSIKRNERGIPMISADQISKCVAVARRFGATKLVLFGSAVDDPENAHDIDLLCEGVDDVEFFRMGAEMENETLAVVDIVPIPPVTRFTEYNIARGKVLHES
jgi:predicted nucleotidyltransferase